MVDTVLFDLDGTLTDSFEGIANSIIYALGKLGLPLPSREALVPFMGPPLRVGLRRLGVAGEDMERAVVLYREYYAEKGLFENAVYPGMPETLETLKTGGKRLAVATSKAAKYAVVILEHFGLLPYFEFVAGAEMDGSRSHKTEVIRHALETLGANPASTVMVGDRDNDIIGARDAGLRAVAVLYGYGPREELEAAGADVFAMTPKDILRYIM
jgi:phosphoglycolate phosphatase